MQKSPKVCIFALSSNKIFTLIPLFTTTIMTFKGTFLSIAFLSCTQCISAQTGHFSFATMNVDGLPPKIELEILGMPLSITINEDGKGADGARAIANKMKIQGLDFLGVNEDFNYHADLMESLAEDGYVAFTHRGGMSVEEAGGITVALANFSAEKPLVQADGLNLICKTTSDNATSAKDEDIVAWTDAYGYMDHYNDALTTKGFRYYHVTTGDAATPCELDVYVLHMDAGDAEMDGDDGDQRAREKQMEQLLSHISQKLSDRPIIIMGDFNCLYTRDHLKSLFIDPLEALGGGEQLRVSDCWIVTSREGAYPECDPEGTKYQPQNGEVLDKIIYVNNAASPMQLVLDEFRVGTDFLDADGTPLSDHFPVFARMSYYDKTSGVEAVLSGASASDIYDINGRHLNAPSHEGVNIVGGKKVLGIIK